MAYTPFGLFAESGILVTGNARSGTTLLVSLLDGHPQTMTLPVETKFSTAMRGADPAAYLSRERCLAQMRGDVHRGARHDFDYDNLLESFESYCAGRDDHKTLFTAVVYAFHNEFQRLGLDSGRLAHWVEKTPAHYRMYDFFKQSFGRLRNVHMVRNPLDLFASWRKRHPDNTLERLERETADSLEHVLAHGDEILVVRYEDLVGCTQCVVGLLTAYLGLEHDERLYSPTTMGQPYAGNSSHGQGFSDISTDSLYTFADHLEPGETAWIARHCREFMTRFGYDALPLEVAR